MAESNLTKLAVATAVTMPRRKPGFIWRKMEGMVVIFNPDSNETYMLNQTAAAIWELCDSRHSIEDIIDVIVDRFEAGNDRMGILQDIMEFLTEGKRNGYILEGER